MSDITFNNEALGGSIAWSTTVTSGSALRTELAQGSAVESVYTSVTATNTFTTDLSAVPGTWTIKTK